MWKEKRFNVFSATLWAKQKVTLICLTPRDYHLQFIVSCLRLIKLSTLSSHELLAFIFFFSPLLVSSPKQSVFIFERVTSKKTKFSNSYSFPTSKNISGSVNVANSVIRKSCNSKQSNNICGELPNWNKFLIWTAKY